MRRLIGLLGLCLVWELGARCLGHVMFPPFSLVLIRLFTLGEIVDDALISVGRVLGGFAIALLLGELVALLIIRWKAMDVILTPVVDAIRPIAALTLFPLFILLLGIGEMSKIVVIFWTSWPAVLLNTVQGLRDVDVGVLEAAELEGASWMQIMRYVRIPLAFPMILTGWRIGLSGGWISLVSAEMLGSSRGLGFSILAYSQTFRFAEMYAVVLLIALIGLSLNVVLAFVQQSLDYKEKSCVESPFVRFHARASSFGIDRLWRES